MKYRSYNSEFITSTAQLLDVFDQIVIDRRDKSGVQQLIHVPCVFGNRSRILKSLENRNKTLKVPMMAITMGSISRDSTRVHEINHGITLQSREWDYDPIKTTAVPVNIEYELSIISKYQEDLDQIICNFIPFSNPDFYVVWPHPKTPKWNMKSQIVWDGNISVTYADEVSETDPYRIIATTSFVFKTWIFPGLDKDKNDGPVIHKINFCPNLLSIGDGNYGLDRWYDVPSNIEIDDYFDSVVCGLIKPDRSRDNWDFLPSSGEMSGYWMDISGAITDTTISGHINGNPVYLVTDNGDLLIIADASYVNSSMAKIDYDDFYQSTITGELSACCNPSGDISG